MIVSNILHSVRCSRKMFFFFFFFSTLHLCSTSGFNFANNWLACQIQEIGNVVSEQLCPSQNLHILSSCCWWQCVNKYSQQDNPKRELQCLAMGLRQRGEAAREKPGETWKLRGSKQMIWTNEQHSVVNQMESRGESWGEEFGNN